MTSRSPEPGESLATTSAASPQEQAYLPAIVEDTPAFAASLLLVEEAIPVAVLVDEQRPSWPKRVAAWLRQTAGRGAAAVEWLFGGLGIIFGLAILASIPGLQLLSLGYLLEVSGRVGKSGRLRDGCVGYRQAARVTGIVVGIALVLLPLRLAANFWRSAALIDPQSLPTRNWGLAVAVLTLLVVIHLLTAFWRGGRMRHFLWPFFRPIRVWRQMRQANLYVTARDAVWDFVVALRLPYYFWLGMRGLAGGLVWLLLPVTLLAFGPRFPLAGWIGVLLLAWVLPALPFLQTHLAVTGRTAAMFDRRAVRRLFTNAPLAFSCALWVTLLSALPLYLLKIELVPREAAWLPSLVFVAFILPARLLTGWAYGRGLRRPTRRHWISRLLGRVGMLPVVGLYVLVVFLTQYTAWYGSWSLYEQHAFLLPAPFLDWLDWLPRP